MKSQIAASFIVSRLMTILVCFTFSFQITAQQGNKKISDSLFKLFTVSSLPWYNAASKYYAVIASPDKLSNQKIIRRVSEDLSIVEIGSPEEFIQLSKIFVAGPANNLWKLSPTLVSKEAVNNTEKFILTSNGLKELLNILSHFNEVTVFSLNEPSGSVIISCKHSFFLKSILPLQEVIFADKYFNAVSESAVIGYKRHFNSINTLDFSLPLADGKNIVAGVKEQRMDSNDLDLYKRVLPSSLAAPNLQSHATTISTLIGGAGNSFYDGRGLAKASKFFSSSFADLFADDAAILNQNKVTVQNHSYGTVIQQFYGAEAVSYDLQTWQNKNLVHIFSAGNQGTSAATDGRYANIPNYANLTGNFKMAKNIITVGAIDDKGNIAPLSSAGPLFDGRLAPQLIALGPGGTSDAAAIVSGTVAVMQQVYADSNSNTIPPASLIKSVLYSTADDLHRTGIDYKTGYGLLNSYEAVKTVMQKKYDDGSVSNGQVWEKNIPITNCMQFKVTLSWTDSAAAVNNNKALINDLDLELEEPGSGIVYKPWVLSAAANADSLEKLPVRKRDSLNTAEQVTIWMPADGNYIIRVKGSFLASPAVAFHVAWRADTINTFSFTNPLHSSDINSDEDPVLPIKWQAALADTNQTGNLFISYNNGANWQLLKAGHKLFSKKHDWPIKDTASAALFKMETPFGDFLSAPVVISKVTRPQLDFLCDDSLRISWRKHSYASAYDIYALADSAYLKRIRTVADTFAVFQRVATPYSVYAVEPVLNNNIPAARSIAYNINFQGVKCFYRALNYVLIDSNNVNLLLELSTTVNVDSISYERITIQGNLIERYGQTKISSGFLTYNYLVTSLPRGVNIFRARIKLNSGAVIYTETVSVLSTGENNILVYPNPVKGGTTLNFALKNQVQYFQLQLLDVNGRLIKQWEVAFSGNIRLPAVSPGIYFYRLIDDKGKMQGSGKLLIN